MKHFLIALLMLISSFSFSQKLEEDLIILNTFELPAKGVVPSVGNAGNIYVNTVGQLFVSDGAAWIAQHITISGEDYLSLSGSDLVVGKVDLATGNTEGFLNANRIADGAIGNTEFQNMFHSGNANTGTIDWNARSFISQVATGTQPYQTASTTLNTNLNADLLDGSHASDFVQLSTANVFTNTNRFNETVTLEKQDNTDVWMIMKQGIGNVTIAGREDFLTVEASTVLFDVNSFRIDLSNTTGDDSYSFSLSSASFDHELTIDNIDGGGDDLIVRSPDGGLISINNSILLQKTKIDANGSITKYINNIEQGSIEIADDGVITVAVDAIEYIFDEVKALFDKPLWVGTATDRTEIENNANVAEFNNIVAGVEVAGVKINASGETVIVVGGADKLTIASATSAFTTKLTAVTSLPGSAVFDTRNTSVTGLGASIQGGTAGLRTLTLRDYTGALAVEFFGDGDGNFVGNLTAANFPASDRRIKTNISDIQYTRIDDVDFKQFNIPQYSDTVLRFGAVAQDVEDIIEDLVYTKTDSMKTKGIYYIDLLILEAARSRERVQELKDQNIILLQRLEAIENKLN